MEDHMKFTLITLMLLSLALTGCIIEPYGDQGDRGGGYYGPADHGPHGDWGR
jgi:hypothetical protein